MGELLVKLPWLGLEPLMPPLLASWKGRHLRNILRREKGSLLTAVAMVYSISITWNLALPETKLKTSKMS